MKKLMEISFRIIIILTFAYSLYAIIVGGSTSALMIGTAIVSFIIFIGYLIPSEIKEEEEEFVRPVPERYQGYPLTENFEPEKIISHSEELRNIKLVQIIATLDRMLYLWGADQDECFQEDFEELMILLYHLGYKDDMPSDTYQRVEAIVSPRKSIPTPYLEKSMREKKIH